MRARPVLLLLATLLLGGCFSSKTVIVTQEVTRQVEVTRIVVKEPEPVESAATYTPYPTYTPYSTPTALPTSTATPTAIPTTGPTATPTAMPTSVPTDTPTPGPTRPAPTATPYKSPTPALQRIPDTDPGPPFLISVSANRAGEASTYKVTGTMRNDGSETFEAIGIVATFFDDQGFRHGPLQARVPFLLLAPGETTPFSVELAARRVVSFLLHPQGRPTGRQSAPVELRNLNLVYDSTESVRITGRAVNVNPFKVKNVALGGVLLDAGGQIVSLGSAFVLQEDIQPNAAVSVDLRIDRVPFVRYYVYAQAERDWE